ncbi:hypothetical protein NHQ30_009485 [Ciborinia camelliae]|nr:hypothetical protein NHQ30_009485 [Ciborinia camelliae]
MVFHKLRTLLLCGIILVLYYTWKSFIPSNVVYVGEAVIPHDAWDQVKNNNEILHDGGTGKERVTATRIAEEVKTSVAAEVLATTSSRKKFAPLQTSTPKYTPYVAAEPSKYRAAQNGASKSRPQYHLGQKQSSGPKKKGTQQAFNPMIKDNFPLAMNARSAADLPPIPPWNRPPTPHVKEKTPLFIAFTRNWPLLQQAVVAWITSGWPAEDIYVVENTGTMKSNEFGRLSLQNPFFMNHTRLHMLGVNVMVTPTFYTFSQLQNFFLWTAIERDLDAYFWSHMDIIPITFEDAIPVSNDDGERKTIYQHAVEVLRSAQSPDPDPNASDPSKPWAMRFFAFDYLTLVNRAAFESVGGFDTTIPFYHTDCDMYDRLAMAGYETNEPRRLMTTVGENFDGLDRAGNGMIFDVANSLDDLIVLYRKKDTVKASFTDQSRPEDMEASRRLYEKQLAMRRKAKDRKKAKEAAAQAAIYDDNSRAHEKAMKGQGRAQGMKKQVELDDKAKDIKKQEGPKAKNEGQVINHPKTNNYASEGYGSNNAEIQSSGKQQEFRQGKGREEKESIPVVTKDSHKSDSSITSHKMGEYKKRDLNPSTNLQSESSKDLHHDTNSNPTTKKSTIPSISSSSSLDLDSKWTSDEPGSSAYLDLIEVADDIVRAKYSRGSSGRNTWQHQQSGGQGEPYYRNPDGFERAIDLTTMLGRRVYEEKWGTLKCKLVKNGITMADEWLPRNWDFGD